MSECSGLAATVAAHTRWSRTDADARRAATEKAREVGRTALLERLAREVDPDGTMDPDERERRVEHARRAHFARLALKSHAARREALVAARRAADRRALAEAQKACQHDWPAELEPTSTCLDCGLPYAEFGEPER
jgi:hypothetical protein